MFIKHIAIRYDEIIVRKASDGTYNVRPVWESRTGIRTHYFFGLSKSQAVKKVDYYAGRHITW